MDLALEAKSADTVNVEVLHLTVVNIATLWIVDGTVESVHHCILSVAVRHAQQLDMQALMTNVCEGCKPQTPQHCQNCMRTCELSSGTFRKLKSNVRRSESGGSDILE